MRVSFLSFALRGRELVHRTASNGKNPREVFTDLESFTPGGGGGVETGTCEPSRNLGQ